MGTLYNHVTAPLSGLEQQMSRHIPPGGNWRSIPESIPSARLAQIRRMTKERGVVRTTYYGRLRWDKPAYTISTYFHRMGNGCFLHPEQDRLISLREAARLQSFPDKFRFLGPKTSQYLQIGNAVPPLMAYQIARAIGGASVLSLFSGAGGFSLGFKWAKYSIRIANEVDRHSAATFKHNFSDSQVLVGDIRRGDTKDQVFRAAKKAGGIDVIIGGPPCQGFSLAGWHDSNDPRNLLPREFINVVDELRPAHFVMENVQGLLWMEKGKVLKTLLDEFAKLGYITTHGTLKGEEFGTAQLRRRVFILGSLDHRPHLPTPLFGTGGLTLNTTQTVWDAISDLPPLERGGGSEEAEYDENWARTSYQKWARGKISLGAFLTSNRPAWMRVSG